MELVEDNRIRYVSVTRSFPLCTNLTHYDIGTYLLRQYVQAREQSRKQRIAFEEHNDLYDSDVTDSWKDMLEQWYEDPSSVIDPFEEPAIGTLHVDVSCTWTLIVMR